MSLSYRFAGVALLLSLPVFAQEASAASFKEVRDRVYARPLVKLPKEPGLTPLGFMQAVTTHSGELVTRIKTTLADSSDFKPSAPKLLHPMGVCAEADWIIDRYSRTTGLLSEGTRVKAIVRLSAADTQTEFSHLKKRMFGMAIKLFPAADEDESVETRNIFTLDNSGLDGSNRRNFLGDLDDREVYFENQARGSGLAVMALERLFRHFDSDPTMRPLYPLTEVTSDGSSVLTPYTPSLVRLTPRMNGPLRSARDFRDELRGYPAGGIWFEISLPPQTGNMGLAYKRPIGKLVIGKPVVSMACDRELHFRHHPTR